MVNEHGPDPMVHELAREIAQLKRHIRQVEVASQAAFRSIEEGSIDVYDEDGNLRERFGKQTDGSYGRKSIKGEPPPAPTEPDVVTVKDGLIVVTWDGRFEERYAEGEFRNVQIHLGDTIDFTPTRNTQEGAIFARRGGSVVVVTDSDTDNPQYVRLVATNHAGEASAPSVAVLVDEEDPDALDDELEVLEFWQDTHTVTTPGTQSIQLTYEPEQESEHLYWNGLYQPASEWTRLDQTITVPDPDGYLEVGDELVVEYAYYHADVTAGPALGPDVPGLIAWYSADQAAAEFGATGTMTAWTDLSGNGNHATAQGGTKPTVEATTGPAGGPAVRFGGAGWFTFPNMLALGDGGGTMAMRVKGEAGNRDSWVFGDYAGSVASCHYPLDGSVFERFGMSADARLSFAPTVPVTDWRRYTVVRLGSNIVNSKTRAYLDAVLQGEQSSTTGWPTTPALGVTALSGALRTTSPWLGRITTLMFFDHELTDTERATVDDWLLANPSGGGV